MATRGEVASQIMRTCKTMGIQTVGIYCNEHSDINSPHTSNADIAFCIGEENEYFNSDTILSIAEKSGAQAIFPGNIQQLTRNSNFVKTIERHPNLSFIGPSSFTINCMFPFRSENMNVTMYSTNFSIIKSDQKQIGNKKDCKGIRSSCSRGSN